MNLDTQMQALLKAWQTKPSQETLTLLHKRAKRTGRHLMCGWGMKSRELVDVSFVQPFNFICYTDITIPTGTVAYFHFNFAGYSYGSGNMDTQAMNHSREVNVVIDSPTVTQAWDREHFEPSWRPWYIYPEFRGTLQVDIKDGKRPSLSSCVAE